MMDENTLDENKGVLSPSLSNEVMINEVSHMKCLRRPWGVPVLYGAGSEIHGPYSGREEDSYNTPGDIL